MQDKNEYNCSDEKTKRETHYRDISLAQARDYYEVVVTDDIFSLEDIPLRRDEQKARKLMRSYARNVSIPAADETL